VKVVVIGSGLAAVAAIKTLIEKNVQPLVLDTGETLEREISLEIDRISQIKKENWSREDIEKITFNPSVRGSGIPKKLLFGSSYFYGKSTQVQPVFGRGELPPFSYALGGLSVGWGSAVLPIDDSDLTNWELTGNDLAPFYRKILSDIPYSAVDDELSLNFPLYKKKLCPLKLSSGNRSLLEDLRKSGILKKGERVFGQARLLTNADKLLSQGCQYCGYCMSGCAYGSIYKAGDEIKSLIDSKKIKYYPGLTVIKLEEKRSKVVVFYRDKNNKKHKLLADKVILAAGALNSTRIVLSSQGLYETRVRMKSRAGFVVPMISFKKRPSEWPNSNTQPGLFLEFKVGNLDGGHWVHTQFSTPNELVFKKLGIDFEESGFIANIKKRVAEHLVIAFCNMHSDYADDYEFWLEKGGNNKPNILRYSRVKNPIGKSAIQKTLKELSVIGRKIGIFPISPFLQVNSGAYHVGATMPMNKQPKKHLETDLLGRPFGMENVHVVDSSVFNSLPGTTIGLLIMANAARIVSGVRL